MEIYCAAKVQIMRSRLLYRSTRPGRHPLRLVPTGAGDIVPAGRRACMQITISSIYKYASDRCGLACCP
uniref:Uncharacterized protein n=1 Tax=Arundo donax TaxID=35708 RepID=A0A0A8Z7H4_ARUDO